MKKVNRNWHGGLILLVGIAAAITTGVLLFLKEKYAPPFIKEL